jgi:saccharopine dehydrogenase (NADP+, L-glutamate forming)
VMKSINMLDDSLIDYSGMTFAEFVAERSGLLNSNDLLKNLSKRLGLPEDCVAFKSFEWLGLFSHVMMEYGVTTPFEITSNLMIKKMSLKGKERDMVLLQHNIEASYPDGRKENIISSMIDFGSLKTNTSISRTVALPAAIAVRMILEKEIELAGVHRPVIPEIYNPVLNELKTLGIELKEEVLE